MQDSQIEKLKEKGLFGSTLDPLWDGEMHKCCGSTRSFYHRKGCKLCSDSLENGKLNIRVFKNEVGNEVRLNKHLKRKNNDIVAAMYAMYCLPKSLEEVGKAYRKSRQCIYDLFHSRGYPLRSKQLKGLTVVDGIKFTLTRGGYLRGTVNKKRVLLHQYIWVKHHGEIPKGHVLFFIDHNHQNVSIENLKAIPKSMMSVYFNPSGNNQFTKKKV
jgi:hypothetical protein